MAFKGPKIEIPWKLVQERAQYVQKHWGLPTKKWVKGLKHSNFGQEKSYLKI
jgi:hypothetical protein